MHPLEQTGHVERAWHFTSNAPVLVVARDAASQLQSLSDLPRAERLVFGVEEVPIGRYTARILERAGTVWGADFRSRVEAKVVSRELNVRQVLAKVRLQEAQAGIVYATDARAAADVQVVRIPDEINVVAQYPIARLKRAQNPELAQAFVDFVRGAAGQAILERAGFLPVREH